MAQGGNLKFGKNRRKDTRDVRIKSFTNPVPVIIVKQDPRLTCYYWELIKGKLFVYYDPLPCSSNELIGKTVPDPVHELGGHKTIQDFEVIVRKIYPLFDKDPLQYARAFENIYDHSIMGYDQVCGKSNNEMHRKLCPQGTVNRLSFIAAEQIFAMHRRWAILVFERWLLRYVSHNHRAYELSLLRLFRISNPYEGIVQYNRPTFYNKNIEDYEIWRLLNKYFSKMYTFKERRRIGRKLNQQFQVKFINYIVTKGPLALLWRCWQHHYE